MKNRKYGILISVLLLMLLAFTGCKTESTEEKTVTPKTETPAVAEDTSAATEDSADTVSDTLTETAEAAETGTEGAAANEEDAGTGSKAITLSVTNAAGEITEYTLNTDAEFLRQAMDEALTAGFTYAGSESDYGIMIETINGEDAIYSADGSYWAIYVNGEYGMYGADSQPVADGDVFGFVYTK